MMHPVNAKPRAGWLAHPPATFALLSIQAIFLLKYGERIAGFWPAAAASAAISAAFLWPPLWRMRIGCRWRWWVLAAWALCLAVALHRFTPQHFQVDRWDAVYYWWQALLRGEFPYSARTRFDGFPSPLPFLQVVLAPFALGVDLAWATLLGWGSWVAWIWRRAGSVALPHLMLALLAPPVLWEIMCRSTLFVNSLLFMAFLWLSLTARRTPIVLGGCAGLLLSTRLAFAVPLAGWGLTELASRRHNLRQMIVIGLCALVVFGLTLLPLWMAWGGDAFRMHNPFGHHQRHMPLIGTAFLLSLSLALGWLRPQRPVQNASWVVLGFGILYCINAVATFGWHQAWYAHNADISYFLFAWPLMWTTPLEAPSGDSRGTGPASGP